MLRDDVTTENAGWVLRKGRRDGMSSCQELMRPQRMWASLKEREMGWDAIGQCCISCPSSFVSKREHHYVE